MGRGVVPTLALAAVCMALSLVIARELTNPPGAKGEQHPPNSEGPGPEKHLVSAPASRFPPADMFDEMVQRPLFYATRRPEEPEEETEAVQAPSAPDRTLDSLTLTGIVHSPETNLAIFQDKRSKKVLRVEQGESIGSWEVVQVGDDAVSLRQGTQERELKLYQPASKPPPGRRSRASKRPPRATGAASGPVVRRVPRPAA